MKYLLSTGRTTTRKEEYILDLFRLYLGVNPGDVPYAPGYGYNFTFAGIPKSELYDKIEFRMDAFIKKISESYKNEWYIIQEQGNLIESEFLSPIEKMLETILKDLIDNIEKDPDKKNSFKGILDDIHKGNIIPIRFRKNLIDSIKVRIKQSTIKVDDDEDTRFKEVINKIKSCRNFKEKLEFYCNLRSSFSINDQDPLNSRIFEHFKNSRLEKYFSKFGLDGCREEMFNPRSLKRKLQNMTGECTELKQFVHSYFHLGFYTLKDIKIAFSGIYRYFGIHKAPKATDILEYFNVQDKMTTDKETKKRVKGYELISIK